MNGEKYSDPTADEAVREAMRGRATPDMLLTIRTLRDLAKSNYGDLNRKLKLYKGDLEVAKSFSEGR